MTSGLKFDYGFFRNGGEGDTCESCLMTDMLDRDPETGFVAHSLIITTDSCPRCGEDIRRCEDCVMEDAPHQNGCEEAGIE